MKKIVIATNNQGKLEEIKKILTEYECLSLKDVGLSLEIEEDQDSFEGNAKKKAETIAKKINLPCIADDSGLCIEALNDWPGVRTARILGEKTTQEKQNQAILEKMKGQKNRKAKVVCVIAFSANGKTILTKGEIKGNITKEPRGNNGFGFDPIVEVEGGKTLAELTKQEKNQISSRKLALKKLKEKIGKKETV